MKYEVEFGFRRLRFETLAEAMEWVAITIRAAEVVEGQDINIEIRPIIEKTGEE